MEEKKIIHENEYNKLENEYNESEYNEIKKIYNKKINELNIEKENFLKNLLEIDNKINHETKKEIINKLFIEYFSLKIKFFKNNQLINLTKIKHNEKNKKLFNRSGKKVYDNKKLENNIEELKIKNTVEEKS